MSMNLIQRIDEIPVPDSYRKRTDNCCSVFAALFSLSLFIYACMVWNTQNVFKTNFPSDADGNICGSSYPGYPFVYFNDIKDMTRRLCVSHCPSLQDTKLKCRPTSRIGCFRRPPLSPSSFRMYDTEPSKSRLGHFCLPKDTTVRQILLAKSGMLHRATFVQAYDLIALSLFAMLTLGAVYLLLVQLCPGVMHYAAIVLGGVASIALGVMLFLNKSPQYENLKLLRYGLIGFFIAAGLFALLMVLMYRRYLRVSAVFLKYSTTFISQAPGVLIYVLLLLAFTVGLVALTLFELLAIWAADPPAFHADRIFYVSHGKYAVFLTVLVFIQLYWGLAFLKELFNFCISGNAINWYFNRPSACWSPLVRVMRFHFGSVVGGSFMVGFFSLADFLFDIIKPDNYMGMYGRCYYPICGWLTSLFELVRSDSMAYINLTGLPYCNSSRYCQFLCNNTRLYHGSQSVSRYYRIAAHLLLISLVGLFAIIYKPTVSLLVELLILVLAVYVVTFFIDVHADASEGLSITFLAEEYLEIGDYRQVKRASPELVNQLLQASNISYP